MQEARHPGSFSKSLRVGEEGNETPRYRHSSGATQQSSAGKALSRSNSGNPFESQATEAGLRAQLIELRRELANSQQEVECSRADLQRRQELLRSAAGEARREVLALRKDKQDNETKLAEARSQIELLENELLVLQEKLDATQGAHLRSDSEASLHEWSERQSKEQQALHALMGAKERALEELRSNARVHAASKQALAAQMGELVAQVSRLQTDLDTSEGKCKRLQEEVSALNQECNKHASLLADYQKSLETTRRDHAQAVDRADMLENELETVRAEATADRLAAVNRQLELEQRCAELASQLAAQDAQQENTASREEMGSLRMQLDEARAALTAVRAERDVLQRKLEAWPLSDQATNSSPAYSPFSNGVASRLSDAASPSADGLRSLLSPPCKLQGIHSPERRACRRVLQLPTGFDAPLEDLLLHPSEPSLLTDMASHRGSASSDMKLTTELGAAAVFLHQLNTRLVQQTSPRGVQGVSCNEANDVNAAAVAQFQAALAALQESLQSRDLGGSQGKAALVPAAGKKQLLPQAHGRGSVQRHRLTQNLLGGIFLIPALAVAAAFLPARS